MGDWPYGPPWAVAYADDSGTVEFNGGSVSLDLALNASFSFRYEGELYLDEAPAFDVTVESTAD